MRHRFFETAIATLVAAAAMTTAWGQALPGCEETVDAVTGDIRNYCFPPDGQWNGNLVIWAHGFQDATEDVSIPVEQLVFEGVALPDIVTGLGFAFATNSYRKTGLAIKDGQQDILDMVDEFTARYGAPGKIYLTGASEGGIITTLLVEKHPEVFNGGGVAACGPIGDFPFQLNYFGNCRATFEVFFPGLIPGDPFDPDPDLIEGWGVYYTENVEPVILDPENRDRFEDWVAVADMPFDDDDFVATAAESAEDVLRYAVVNLHDAIATLGGFPFDNQTTWYSGTGSFLQDLLVNILVQRVAADPAARDEMRSDAYQTTGILHRPLITVHTQRDQQVPYLHEVIYSLKHLPTVLDGTSTFLRLNWAIDRYGHCAFTADEAVIAFVLLLIYDSVGDALGSDAADLIERLEAEPAVDALSHWLDATPARGGGRGGG